MRDQNADTGEVVVAKGPPQTLVEAADSVVGICGTLAVRYAVEEVAVVCALLPHALHFGRAWLEVAKVLLSQARLFEDGDLVAWEGRRRGVVRGQRAQDALCRLARSAVGRGEELERVVGFQQGSELTSCFLCLRASYLSHGGRAGLRGTAYLRPAMLGKFDPVVRDELVDIAVLVSLGLGMANEDNHLHSHQQALHVAQYCAPTRGFPILEAAGRAYCTGVRRHSAEYCRQEDGRRLHGSTETSRSRAEGRETAFHVQLDRQRNGDFARTSGASTPPYPDANP